MNATDHLGELFLQPGGSAGGARFERTFATTVEELWSCLVLPERLNRWFAPVSGDLRPGGSYLIEFSDADRTTGEVLVCEPPRRLELTWRFPDQSVSLVRAELRAEGAAAVLSLEHTGLPLSQLAGYGAGWQAYLEALDADLAGAPATDWDDRWSTLLPAYQAALGLLAP
jgi:uncharacterized protein YndB with AHSA1/START domain